MLHLQVAMHAGDHEGGAAVPLDTVHIHLRSRSRGRSRIISRSSRSGNGIQETVAGTAGSVPGSEQPDNLQVAHPCRQNESSKAILVPGVDSELWLGQKKGHYGWPRVSYGLVEGGHEVRVSRIYIQVCSGQ